MRVFSLVLLLLLLGTNLFSQEDTDFSSCKRVTLSSDMVGLIPSFQFGTVTYNAGAEVYLKNKKSITVNVGWIKGGEHSGLFAIHSQGTDGFKGQLEIKHYLGKYELFEPAILLFWPHIFQYKTQKHENSGYYVACQTSFQTTETLRSENVPGDNGGEYYKNDYSVNRKAGIIDVKVGYQCVKKYGITIDQSIGVGLQFISSYPKNRLGGDSRWPASQKELLGKNFESGKGFFPHIAYQLKLGWSFGKF
ncbi:hypothetical protein [Parvicella tangerina]|uniref:Outer membrane protein beta-barrel domain-containing protein n=1 Tax=Parvicella tangerina TaxID=2829795 RepID=A0A916JPX7_9FLAO|nr:hypothetical protein [Parvicella tangerina]CAG5084960.1 hypothetical protein CRYO30217_02610 [Parvicella tangerina]